MELLVITDDDLHSQWAFQAVKESYKDSRFDGLVVQHGHAQSHAHIRAGESATAFLTCT